MPPLTFHLQKHNSQIVLALELSWNKVLLYKVDYYYTVKAD